MPDAVPVLNSPQGVNAGQLPPGPTDQNALPADFSPQAAAPAGPSSAAPAAELPADFLPQDFNPPSQVQGPPEKTIATGMHGIVKAPDGSYAVQEPDGQLRPLTDKEKKGASYIAAGLRFAGPLGGMLLGGGTVASGVLSVAGGEAVHPIASELESIAGEAPHQRTWLERGLEAAAPGLSKIPGAMLPGMAKVAEEALAGTPSKLSQIAPATIEKLFTKTRDEVGPTLSETDAKNVSFRDEFKKIRKGYQDTVSDLKAKSYLASGGEKYPLPELLPKMQQTLGADYLDENGSFRKRLPEGSTALANLYSDIRDSAGAQGGKGLDIRELDNYTKRAQGLGNYDSISPTPSEVKARQIARQLREARDDTMSQVFAKAGDANSGEQLKLARDNIYRHEDTLRDVIKALDENPTNVEKNLIKRDNPETVRNVYEMLDKKHQDILSGKFLDRMAEEGIDKMKEYDPKTLDTVLGGNRDKVEALLNYAKVASRPGVSASRIADIAARASRLLLSPKYGAARESVNFVSHIFKENPEVQAKVLGDLYREFPADIKRSATANTLKIAQAAAQWSPKANAAAAEVGSHLISGLIQQKEPNRQPQSEVPLSKQAQADIDKRMQQLIVQRIREQEAIKREKEKAR